MNKVASIDLNADLGEMPDAINRDISILSLVSSANIACGGHAGDAESMRTMIRYAKENNVRIGAHPSYPDKLNFGRKSINIKPKDLTHSLNQQITMLMHIAAEESAIISYVKPHGTLYNEAMDDAALSALLIDVIKHIDPSLAIMGMAQSELEKAAMRSDLNFIAEAFIDRRYNGNARLQSRSIEGAIISDYPIQSQQALALACGNAISVDGEELYIKAHSLCIHGDSESALDDIAKLRKMLLQNGIMITASHA